MRLWRRMCCFCLPDQMLHSELDKNCVCVRVCVLHTEYQHPCSTSRVGTS